ncbi:MAG: hypothetical protein LBS99_07035 [Clostridiales bacterium]|jgi:hypothetical protein|nr:hypothetical protein [Clostridiales bacterium]
MGFVTKLKYCVIKNNIDKRKKKSAFNAEYSERYTLPPDADGQKNNSYYFSAHGADGTSLFFRLGLRGGGIGEIWCCYYNADGVCYKNTIDIFTGGAVSAKSECIEVAKKWAFGFHGDLTAGRLNADKIFVPAGRKVSADFQGEFTFGSDIFEFSRHMASKPIARAMSLEKWTKAFKEAVMQNHQVHYEQAGTVTGVLKADGKTYLVDSPAIRDHSYGHREWGYMDRHIWLSGLMEDGTVFNLNMVRYPALKFLQTGYLIEADKHVVCVDRATALREFVPDGKVPAEFGFTAVFEDGRELRGTCKKEAQFDFGFDGGAYTICEGVGTFLINGVKGRGILEFGYNGDPERWGR